MAIGLSWNRSSIIAAVSWKFRCFLFLLYVFVYYGMAMFKCFCFDLKGLNISSGMCRGKYNVNAGQNAN